MYMFEMHHFKNIPTSHVARLDKIAGEGADQFYVHLASSGRIIDIEDNSVLIEKDIVPVSRSNRPELMKRLNLL